METSPPTNSLVFNDISFATIPPLKVPVKGTPPMISELFDGTYKRPPKETSLPTKTLPLKLESSETIIEPIKFALYLIVETLYFTLLPEIPRA